MTPKYLVIHTAAFSGRNCDAERIDKWHKQRGWNGIGYHYVILNDKHDAKEDGLVETGRNESIPGAHARGINSQSLGICCIGHGDRTDFTEKQYESLFNLLYSLAKKYDISVDNIIGHRELNTLIRRGQLARQYRTNKSCPGRKVNMDDIRREMIERLESEPVNTEESKSFLDLDSKDEIVQALKLLKKHKDSFGNANDELCEFLFHPEILEALES